MKVILPIDNYRIVCDFAFSEDNIQTIPIDHLSIRDLSFRMNRNNNFDTYKEAMEIIEKQSDIWKCSHLSDRVSNIRVQHRDVQWYELKEEDKTTWHEKVLGY